MEKRKFLLLSGFELRPLGGPVRSQSLYGLRYPGSLIFTVSFLISKHNTAIAFPLRELYWFYMTIVINRVIKNCFCIQFLRISVNDYCNNKTCIIVRNILLVKREEIHIRSPFPCRGTDGMFTEQDGWRGGIRLSVV
jgi:hypothetical protein